MNTEILDYTARALPRHDARPWQSRVACGFAAYATSCATPSRAHTRLRTYHD